MPRFQFALNTTAELPQAGIVQSATFEEALTAVGEHVDASFGDILEIGVTGFPPARYECIGASRAGTRRWRPAGLLAA